MALTQKYVKNVSPLWIQSSQGAGSRSAHLQNMPLDGTACSFILRLHSIPRTCVQLRQGSVKLANGCDTSTRGDFAGGIGVFHPLHLQSSAW